MLSNCDWLWLLWVCLCLLWSWWERDMSVLCNLCWSPRLRYPNPVFSLIDLSLLLIPFQVTRTEHVETRAPSLAKALRIGKIEVCTFIFIVFSFNDLFEDFKFVMWIGIANWLWLCIYISQAPRQIRRVEEHVSRELSCLNARWVTEQPLCNETNPCTTDNTVRMALCCTCILHLFFFPRGSRILVTVYL